LTVREMKEQMKLPCNYVHDGFYLKPSNEVLNQVYQSLMELNDDDVPVLVECGGHDGITKSLTLKASVCLQMNTLLIEASPSNFETLRQPRSCDLMVNAALCSGESVRLVESAVNSGQTRIAGHQETGSGVTIRCTSLDAELDRLRDTLPEGQRDKLQLIFLVLDIEGQEPFAIDGIQRYSPKKVFMEVMHLNKPHKEKIFSWAKQHNLTKITSSGQDTSFNFHPMIKDKPPHLKSLLYGARSTVPQQTYKTSLASKAYMFYGE